MASAPQMRSSHGKGEFYMLLTTTEQIPGREYDLLGLVKGSTVQSKNLGRDLGASLKTLVGGEIRGYTQMMEEARAVATQRMIDEAAALGADAVGINCGTGPRDMLDNARRLVSCAYVPVFVEPNAGLPRLENGKTIYDTDAEAFSDVMKEACASGVNILGGCCGTTPEYIEKTVKKLEKIDFIPIEKKNKTVVSSYTHAVEIGKRPVLIGERINPTGKKRFPSDKKVFISFKLSFFITNKYSFRIEKAMISLRLRMASLNILYEALKTFSSAFFRVSFGFK